MSEYKALRQPLLEKFPSALLGRMVTVPYYPLSDEMIAAIAKLQLARIEQRIEENHNIQFTYDEGVVKLIASRCTELESGGRMIDSILTNTVLPRISEALLMRMISGEPIAKVNVSELNEEFAYEFYFKRCGVRCAHHTVGESVKQFQFGAHVSYGSIFPVYRDVKEQNYYTDNISKMH